MNIHILSAVPDLMKSPFEHSILKRAQENNLVKIHCYDLRKWAINKHAQIDDYPYGGGAGMVLRCEPICAAIDEIQALQALDAIIYLTPDGKTFNQSLANRFSLLKNVLLICGHYKGIDQRIREHYVTHEISIGDYVISGGELAAAVWVDAVVRLLPGVLNDETSALTDSFQDNLLAPPVYTRPANFKGWEVPPILLSGDAAKINQWNDEKSLERTALLRPDLLDNPL